MPVYLYAVVRPGTEPPVAANLVEPSTGGLRVIGDDAVGALVAGMSASRIAMTSHNVRAHQEVVDMAAEGRTLLPVQFGIVFDSEQAIIDELLVPRAAELRHMLDALEGRVELRVTLTYEGDAALRQMVEGDPRVRRLARRVKAKPAAAGYYDRIALGEMVMQHAAALQQRDLEVLSARLGRLSEGLLLLDQAAGISARLAFLVERTRLDAFEGELDGFAREQGERVSVEMVGPLVPWDFTVPVSAGSGEPGLLAGTAGGPGWGS